METNTMKQWAEMSETEQAAERALPKETRQALAAARGRQRSSSPLGRIAKSKRGTWGRALTVGCRKGCSAVMTAAECIEVGLRPGPGNCD